MHVVCEEVAMGAIVVWKVERVVLAWESFVWETN